MANAALAQALGSLKIEEDDLQRNVFHKATHHVLAFTYPDFSMAIPENEEIALTPPAKMEQRSRPPHDPRELALYDTTFALALPLKQQQSKAHHSNALKRLLAAIEALGSSAGVTSLGVVRVHQHIWDEKVYRVRIATKWVGPLPRIPPQDFELSGAEWDELMTFAEKMPWIGVLDHLTTRASALAYYHVRRNLVQSLGAGGVDDEEKSWPTAWGTERDTDSQELFLRRLIALNHNIVAGKMPHLWLECGHEYHLTCNQATAVNHNDVWRLVCGECGTKIMQAEDEARMDAMARRNTTWRFRRTQRVWANLVRDVQDPNQPRRFHALSVFKILGAALDSLRCPEWVAPSTICPSNFDETAAVLEHLEDMFWGSNNFCEKTAEELLDNLEAAALEVEIDGVPLRERFNSPGWDDFVARWLRRAAYFLAYRRCGRGESGCKGLHGHVDGLWYSPEEWEEKEGAFHERKDSRFDMSEMMKALDEIPL